LAEGCRGTEVTLPDAYARWRESSLGRITDALERRLLLELIRNVGGRTVLDVGCGDGELAVALWQRGARVSGIDASLPMIEAARRRAAWQGSDIAFLSPPPKHCPMRQTGSIAPLR
jgi:2-polyprenyl-3-methyl-5-hydroxy-6-metoxy-1,4-benzoquinol methylase